MPLLTIADLEQPAQDLASYLELANSLSQTYFDYIVGAQDDTYTYTVEVFGSAGRASGIHASEISKCLKQVVYSIMGVQRWSDPSNSDANMQMRFNIGTAVHAMLQNDWHRIAAKSNGRISFEDEAKINPRLGGAAADWDLHSSCDGIITIYDEYMRPVLRIGIEFKTASEKSFADLKSPMDEHKEQTTLYMAALDLPLMWVCYYNKSNSNITTSFPPYVYKFDRKLWESLEMRFAKAHHLASIQQLPQGTEGMYCKWCPFSYACKPKILLGTPPKRDRLTAGMKARTR